MKREQVGKPYIVSVRLHRVLERLVFTIPLLIIGYGVSISYGWVTGSPFFSNEALVVIAVLTTLIVLIRLFLNRVSRNVSAFFLVCNHLLLAAGLLLIFGFLGPVVMVWLLLIVITMTYYGRRWAFVSYLALLTTMITGLITIEVSLVESGIQYALFAFLILTLSVIFSLLRSSESKGQEKIAAAEAKQTEQREALLTIINGTNQAIFTISSGGIIRIYNAALLNLLDTNVSLSGKNVDDILTLHYVDGEPVSLRKLIKKTPRFERDDIVLRFSDGDEIRLHISVNKIQTAFSAARRSGGEGYVCIARDITKEKSLEEERDEFISVVSHELRTPVAITEGTISNLQYFLEKGADTSKLGQSVKAAHEQILLLSNMINDLGTLSRAERGIGDSVERIDVKELAESLYKNYEDTAREKGLVLNLDLGPRLGTVTTSRLYLEEVLQNLLTNAIKYTHEGSVTLHIKRNGPDVEFAVSDTGIGISKSDLKHVFKKFYRSEDYRTRETSGTGLGLYVVTKLMQKLDTRIQVTSRLNHGSTFSFVLSGKEPQTKA